MSEKKPPQLEVRRSIAHPAASETTLGALLDAARLKSIDPRILSGYARDALVPEMSLDDFGKLDAPTREAHARGLVIPELPARHFHEIEVMEGQETSTEDVMRWFMDRYVFIPAVPDLLVYRTLQTTRRFYRNIVSPMSLVLYGIDNERDVLGYPCLSIDGDTFEIRLLREGKTWTRSWTFLGITSTPLDPKR